MKILKYCIFFFLPMFVTAQVDIALADLIPQENAILQAEDISFEVLSPKKSKTRHKYTMTILNESGAEYGEIYLYYSKLNKLDDIKVTLYDSNGKLVKKVKKADIADFNIEGQGTFVDDTRMKYVKVPHTAYPYSLEIEYERTNEAMIFYESWIPQSHPDIAVKQSKFTVKIPNALSLRYKETNAPAKRILKEDKSTTYIWEATDMPAYLPEKHLPHNEKRAITQVLTAPTEFEFEGYKGNMSSWKNFGSFFYQLQQDRNTLSDFSRAQVQELVKSCTTPQCKMEKIYEYLQKNTRYVGIQLGIGGWQPFPAEEVHQKKYGDCKALSNYMVAMLDAIGIKGYSTVIRSGDNNVPIDKDFAANQFNHMIVCIPQAKDTVWLECTSQTTPFGYLGSHTDDRDALLLTPEGGKIVHTPVYKQKDNLQMRQIDGKLDETGKVNIVAKTTYTGSQQEILRQYATSTLEKQQKYLLKRIELPHFDLKSFEFTINNTPKIEEKIALEIPDYAAKTGKRLFIQPNILTKMDAISAATLPRQKPIQTTPFAYEDTDEVRIALPQGYTLEQKIEPITIKQDFGIYTASVRIENGTLMYSRKMAMSGKVISKEKYQDFIEFYKQVAKADKMKVVLLSK